MEEVLMGYENSLGQNVGSQIGVYRVAFYKIRPEPDIPEQALGS